MNRAYSTLEIKTFNDVTREFEGIASTPSPDRMGDVVEPKGAKFKLPLPLLKGHSSALPIGQITSAKVTAEGIHVRGFVTKVESPPSLVDRLDTAYAEIKHGLIRGLSIGFAPLEFEPLNPKEPWGGQRFKTWDWLELSAVVIPANADASILSIKSYDEQQTQAASGQSVPAPVASLKTSPGATGTQSKPVDKGKKMNTKEHIAALEAKRAANIAAMQSIGEITAEKGEQMDADQSEQFDTMQAQVDQIDKDLARYRALERTMQATAKAVPMAAGTNEEVGSKARAGDFVLKPNHNLPKGIGLARYAKALCWARINMSSPVEYAKQWDDSTPEVSLALKTAVGAGTTTDATFASPLVYANNLTSEFVDFLRPKTIIGKIDNLRRVPFNVRYPIQNGGSTVAWVGQGAPKPVSKLSFTSATLGFAKAAGIVVITQELARFSGPSAEIVIRDDMAAQMVYFLDQQFIDPGVAAVANVSPASILNGAVNVRTAGGLWTSMANVLTDVYALMTTFASNEITLDGSYWIMTPDAALRLSLLLNTGGTALAFPTITITGGTFLGIPVIVTNALPHSVSAGSILALVKGSEIFLADDGGVNITVSGEASLNMDTAPTINSATPTATSVVSMFQTDSIAIRAERFINWGVRRAYGVGYIDNMHTTTNP